ncbi:MAG: HD domain-containing protein [Candidatus Sumerlaeia bacterium]|nr:HD domain-containing protein [Candidatus Sumerlaeia bacterium]
MAVNAPAPIARPAHPSHPGIEEVRQWMVGFDPEPEHEQQVTRLALILFDGLQPLHGMGTRERTLLEAAALVHDIGMSVSDRKHHKQSYELITAHRFLMWLPDEVNLFALIARYHRKAEPSLEHREYAALPERDRAMVRKAAAILRVADGLDRAHLSTVQHVDISYNSTTICLKLHTYRDCATEIWGAERKAALLESVLARRLNILPVNGTVARTV